MKGYKVFNHDWTCGGFQYKVGGIFEENDKPKCSVSGFHFYKKVADCFNYYDFSYLNKVAEIIALGEVDTDGAKSCTNKIQIVREISWEELLTIVNTGEKCTGLRNDGDRNTGNRNTGNRNTGNRNTGDKNTGYRNTGNGNTGNWNTGDDNKGHMNTGNGNKGGWNTGDDNIGNNNTGDWNKSSFNTGCFNTKEQKITMFNKPTDITYTDWLRSDARYLLTKIPKYVTKWVDEKDMTDEEKIDNPTYKTTGGYLKEMDESECGQFWWDRLSDSDKNCIKSIPNFDPEIFRECTGIEVNELL